MTKVGKILVSLALAPILVLAAGIGGCEIRKAYYDRQVRKLCEKDGGLQIFEVARLSPADYALLVNEFGQLDIPTQPNARPNTPLIHAETIDYLRENNPRLTRYELRVVRLKDNKTLGARISYSRVGGDFVAFHPSVFACPMPNLDLFSSVSKLAKE